MLKSTLLLIVSPNSLVTIGSILTFLKESVLSFELSKQPAYKRGKIRRLSTNSDICHQNLLKICKDELKNMRAKCFESRIRIQVYSMSFAIEKISLMPSCLKKPTILNWTL